MSLIYVHVSNADGHCSYPNDTLAPSELTRSDYQQGVKDMRRIWHRMECGNETATLIDKNCCSSWCKQLASFFSQASSWRDHCFKMWGCRENEKARMPFSIILTNTTDSSYLGRIKVKQCLTLNFPAIKLTPSSEVGVFDFLATILVSIFIGPLIPPFKECTNQFAPPPPTRVRTVIDISSTFARIMQSSKCNHEYVLSYAISISYAICIPYVISNVLIGCSILDVLCS